MDCAQLLFTSGDFCIMSRISQKSIDEDIDEDIAYLDGYCDEHIPTLCIKTSSPSQQLLQQSS